MNITTRASMDDLARNVARRLERGESAVYQGVTGRQIRQLGRLQRYLLDAADPGMIVSGLHQTERGFTQLVVTPANTMAWWFDSARMQS